MATDWRQCTLEDLVTFQRGFDITKAEQSPGPYPVISSSGPKSTHREAKVKGPCVIIGRKGSLGTVFFADGDCWPHDTTLWVKDFHGNDPRFCFYFLQGMGFEQYDVGASNPTLNRNHIHGLPVCIPPLPTQRRIAAILSAYDDLIEVNTRRIAILEEMARRVYEEWFVRGDRSELGELPLASLVTTQYGYTASTSDVADGPKFLRGMDINKRSYIDWAAVPYCDQAPDNPKKYRLRRNDLLVIRMADPGKVGFVEEDVDAVFASYLIRLSVIDDRIDPLYLFFFLTGRRYQAYITGVSTGTTRKSASAKVVVGIDLPVPPRDRQDAFVDRVGPMRKLIRQLVKQNANLRAQRDLLLPRLVSGKLDVSEAGDALEEDAA